MDWHIPRPSLTIIPHNTDRNPQHRTFGDYYNTEYTIPKYARSLQSEPVGRSRIGSIQNDRRFSGTISTYLPTSIATEWTQTDFDINSTTTSKQELNNSQYLSKNDNNSDENSLQQIITPNGYDLNFDLKKDISDSASVASSTHFTMVNDSRDVGQGSYLHRSKNNSKFHSLSFLCITCEACQGHKLTCLVLTMSFFILTGLAIAILFIEYRARRIQE